jgi:hypothetical protein
MRSHNEYYEVASASSGGAVEVDAVGDISNPLITLALSASLASLRVVGRRSRS